MGPANNDTKDRKDTKDTLSFLSFLSFVSFRGILHDHKVIAKSSFLK